MTPAMNRILFAALVWLCVVPRAEAGLPETLVDTAQPEAAVSGAALRVVDAKAEAF